MSYFIAPDTGARYDIFGTGGAEAAAAKLDMPFLGAVPLVMSIRETSDTGHPVVASQGSGPEAEAFKAIALRILRDTPALRT
jgi:ATP-binding protein involved in chromosome partitioning